MRKSSLVLILMLSLSVHAQGNPLYAKAESLIKQNRQQVIDWRRDFHRHPELSNREFNTAKKIAKQLRSLGLEVKVNIAHTGVTGILRGDKPGPMIALRSDMDALPVTEKTGLSFASKARGEYAGGDVGVMHACGHDTHMAMLLGAAEVLSKMKADLRGSVKFIFQPAEEGAPAGEEGGAELMVKEGVLEGVEAIFGLHIGPGPLGTLGYRSGGLMASSDSFRILVKGSQTHGAMPWAGVDPIVTASQIVLALQTIPSRQLDSTLTPSIVTVGKISGGVRFNIIPDEVELLGTIRTFEKTVQDQIHSKIRRAATHIAASAGASAEVTISRNTPVTYNHAELTARMVTSLENAAGKDKALIMPRATTAEDFAYYQNEIPGLFFWLGAGNPDEEKPAPNHSPYFSPDERAFPVGIRALTFLALDYLAAKNLSE